MFACGVEIDRYVGIKINVNVHDPIYTYIIYKIIACN
jgi:hypothetical protein